MLMLSVTVANSPLRFPPLLRTSNKFKLAGWKPPKEFTTSEAAPQTDEM
jgi:hypothetical protein